MFSSIIRAVFSFLFPSGHPQCYCHQTLPIYPTHTQTVLSVRHHRNYEQLIKAYNSLNQVITAYNSLLPIYPKHNQTVLFVRHHQNYEQLIMAAFHDTLKLSHIRFKFPHNTNWTTNYICIIKFVLILLSLIFAKNIHFNILWILWKHIFDITKLALMIGFLEDGCKIL